jgi:pyocin large subunit-like protein
MSTIKATNFQHASAAAPAIVLAADGSATANVSSINNGPLAGMRNAIINGNFDIWQRGTSFLTGNEYGADQVECIL